MKRPSNQSGFTIIELLIASTVFSVVLLLCMTAIIQVGRMYYKGALVSKTQETSRSITDNITQAIQLSGGTVQATPASIPPNGSYGFCVNTSHYSVLRGRQATDGSPSGTQTRHTLVVNEEAPCPAAPLDLTNQTLVLPPDARSLVPSGMRVAKLRVTEVPNSNLYNVVVRIVSGEDDLLDDPTSEDANCNPGAGSHFCAVSELSTTVQRRL